MQALVAWNDTQKAYLLHFYFSPFIIMLSCKQWILNSLLKDIHSRNSYWKDTKSAKFLSLSQRSTISGQDW